MGCCKITVIGIASLHQNCEMKITALRSEPFLWIHLSGIVLLPGFLAIATLALTIGDSYYFGIELSLLGIVGIIPILFMQWTHPFDIFSILLLSIKPESLTEDRRAILSLFKTFKQKLVSGIAALLMLVVLWLIYNLSPLAIGLVDWLPQWRIFGLTIAAVCFLASNLFLQVPLSALVVLLAQQSQVNRLDSYPIEKIEADFTVPGIPVAQILWFAESATDSLEKS